MALTPFDKKTVYNTVNIRVNVRLFVVCMTDWFCSFYYLIKPKPWCTIPHTDALLGTPMQMHKINEKH